MPGDDPRLLIVPRCVAGQLEDLGCQVLHDGRQVDGGSGSHSLGVVTFPDEDNLIVKLIHKETGNLRSLWILPTGN